MDLSGLVQNSTAVLTTVAWKVIGAIALWLVGRWLIGCLLDWISRFIRRRSAIEQVQARHDAGHPVAAMTRVARHDLAPAEIRLIDAVYHQHHLPSDLLERIVRGVLSPVAAALIDVTVGTIESERC